MYWVVAKIGNDHLGINNLNTNKPFRIYEMIVKNCYKTYRDFVEVEKEVLFYFRIVSFSYDNLIISKWELFFKAMFPGKFILILKLMVKTLI